MLQGTGCLRSAIARALGRWGAGRCWTDAGRTRDGVCVEGAYSACEGCTSRSAERTNAEDAQRMYDGDGTIYRPCDGFEFTLAEARVSQNTPTRPTLPPPRSVPCGPSPSPELPSENNQSRFPTFPSATCAPLTAPATGPSQPVSSPGVLPCAHGSLLPCCPRSGGAVWGPSGVGAQIAACAHTTDYVWEKVAVDKDRIADSSQQQARRDTVSRVEDRSARPLLLAVLS